MISSVLTKMGCVCLYTLAFGLSPFGEHIPSVYIVKQHFFTTIALCLCWNVGALLNLRQRLIKDNMRKTYHRVYFGRVKISYEG